MRDIKFRGKRVDGEWIKGGYFNTEKTDKVTKHFIVTYRDGDSALTEWRIIPETLGQYTGLKDKDGTEIYEGDRIRWWINSVIRDGVMVFSHGCFDCDYIGFDPFRGEYEVIGNIHDGDMA